MNMSGRNSKAIPSRGTYLFRRLLRELSVASALMALVLAISGAATAQQSAATISGVVRDSSGAVVQGATVQLRNNATGVDSQTTANDVGVYRYNNVEPGDYSLSVTKEGFSQATQKDLHILVNQAITQDFSLRPGATTAEIVVQASAVELDTANTAIGEVIEQKSVEDLPLNGRNFTQLLTLSPGVAPVNTGQSGGGGQSNPLGTFVAPSINGAEVRSNYYLLDGIDNTEMNYDVPAVSPIIDDIQEFKVQGHNDEAEFGGVTGGVINVVTKSGTNQIHGAVWEYLRNTIFNANNPVHVTKQKLEQNQFGFNGGGPLFIPHVYDGRNKTFFFGSYEGFRRAQPASNTYFVPTSNELAGDFSDICPEGFTAGLCNNPQHQLYDPFSTGISPNAPGERTPFANNNITTGVTGINPGALAYVKGIFPTPLALGTLPGGGVYNGLDTRSNHTSQTQWNVRGDENFNSSNSAFFRYSVVDQPNTSGAGNTNFTDNRKVTSRQWATNFVHTFGQSSVLTVGFGHNDLTNSDITRLNGDSKGLLTSAGFASSFACSFTGGALPCAIPGLNLSGGNNFPGAVGLSGGGQGESTTLLSDIYQLTGNFTKGFRRHSVSAGANWERDHFHVVNTSNNLTITGAQTADQLNPTAGNALAALLLGVVQTGSLRDTVAPLDGQYGLGFYFMDTWKVSDRFTFNFGLRSDLQYNGTYGDIKSGTAYVGNVDFTNGTYVLQHIPGSCATLNVAPCIPTTADLSHVVVAKNGHLFDNNYAIEPRIGLAYKLNDKTALRAGFGVFNDLWGGVTQRIQNIGGTWPTLGQIAGTPQNDISSVATVNYQNPLVQLGGANIPGNDPFANSQWYQNPHNKTPYSEQWNFGIQRQLDRLTVITANYVGSQTHDLVVGGLYNVAKTPVPGGTLAQIQAQEPYPYINPTFWDNSVGRSHYNALQISANRRSSNGLSYIVAYTWSKAVDLACDGFFGGEGCSNPNVYNPNISESVSGTDLTHVLTAGITAQSPFGKGKSFTTHSTVGDYIVGNWQFNTIATLTSGQPYTVNMDNSTTTLAADINHNIPWDSFNRPDLVGNPNTGHCPNGAPVHTIKCWINPNAFGIPGQDSFGNAPRNSLRGDGYVNFDMSVFRSFPLGEKRSLQFRAEAFNVFNHPTFGNPNATVNPNYLNPASSNFGQIGGTRSTERQLQFALKFYY